MTKPFYTSSNFEPRSSVGALVGQTRKAFFAAIDAELAPLDVSAAQWVIIMQLHSRTTSTAGELARNMNYDPGAMTRLLDRLEKKELLRRVPSASDRRSLVLELTPAGRELQPKIRAAIIKVNNRLLRGFNSDEVAVLEKFLRRMLGNA